ncbi:probable disease resistance protein At4g27220 isoform X2 [Durio zibethinus]|uniref:Probable disease resistance protein At4g27220 isoform X2 n=1 Tax=Durio zibethinus TaxID=66656 RepID=A0A6P5ZKA1_DURZI|nr:probable disease resistance protein At4g27220 isoform X2 [Durio zibethinus]
MCFLLCSLFPEDYEIYVEELVRYAWGLELYKGMGSIEAVRSEVLAAMDILRNSCLLLNCGERHVKMHDLVRDFALWIASNRTEFSFMIKSEVVELWPKDESFEPYKAVSFKTSRIVELPKGLLCPNLKILVLGGDKKMTTSSEFFEGMTALKVCALNSRLISPDAFQFQTNLTTLHLESCKLLDISVLGQLKKLEVLSFSCSDIKELPEEIGDLDNLKLLDLSYCEELQRIPSQLIRRLSKLEELYLHGCQLLKWATESTVREERFASLSELNSFSNLIVLSLEVSSEDIPRDFVFCKLQRFYVCVGFDFSDFYGLKMDSEICPFSRSLKIGGSIIEACKQLFKDTESLNLKDMVGYPNLVPSLESGQVVFSKLTSLGIESCEHMKCLIDTTKQQVLTNAIPILQSLERLEVKSCDEMQVLFQIAELRSIQQGPRRHVSLQSLKVVTIHNCNKLRHLFPTYVADSLGQLEALNISSCLELEEIIPKTEVSNINLQSLREVHIAESTSIQQGPSYHVSLQSLKVVMIYNCDKLRYLFPTSVAESLGQLEVLDISECLELEEIIPKTEVSNINLQSLREVQVSGCSKLTSLSSLSHGQILENLRTLHIWNCSRLEYTFPISMAEGLPQLNEVRLQRLPELKGRDGNDIVLTLPSLQDLCVDDCPQLTPFIISAKIQVLQFLDMRERKQSCNLIVPKLGQKLSNMEYLTIINFEELFDGGYNLSSLKELILGDLPELRVAWKDPIQVVNFQNLTDLNVYRCGRLRYILSPTIARNLPQLSSLWVNECEELEQIIEKDGQTSSEGHHLQPIWLPNLTEIRIYKCENLKSLFPKSVAYGLPKLQSLTVRNVSKLEQVFEQSGDEANGSEEKEKVIQLPQLGTLGLEKLPNLVSFSPVGYHFVFPSLQSLSVTGCPNITTSFSVDSEQSGHAKTEAIRSIDENIVEESTGAQQTTWPIGSAIEWWS